jgi:dTDP-4-dehydrorhamnose reductase
MVNAYLKRQTSLDVTGTSRVATRELIGFDAYKFTLDKENLLDFNKYEYILNCIGIIKPFCKDDDPEGIKNAVVINSLFPKVLSEFAGPETKIIQIATDCVYSGKEGPYSENSLHDAQDVYGKTKSLGEIRNSNFLNIRCSIIGPEKRNFVSLLEWFLNQEENATLQGFTHHKWNGVTTLQFAKLMEIIIMENHFDKLIKLASVHHFLPNNTVNKYELLNIFQKFFSTSYVINAVDDIGPPVRRDLSSNLENLQSIYPKMKMETAIEELKNYITQDSIN